MEIRRDDQPVSDLEAVANMVRSGQFPMELMMTNVFCEGDGKLRTAPLMMLFLEPIEFRKHTRFADDHEQTSKRKEALALLGLSEADLPGTHVRHNPTTRAHEWV